MGASSGLSSSLAASVWRADELLRGAGGVVSSGHAALDAELPSGGWPLGALTELLQPAPDAPGTALLWPAVAARQQAQGGVLVLVSPPHEPFLPALAAAGVAVRRLLWLCGDTPAARLWCAEQALRCADVAAVLAWLPRARTAELRRLHLAAAQRADSLLFALRPEAAVGSASPAPLRLSVRLQASSETALAEGGAALQVDILKRRGPPLTAPVQLPAHDERLRAVLLASTRRRGWRGQKSAASQVLPFGARRPGDHDALDRLAVAA